MFQLIRPKDQCCGPSTSALFFSHFSLTCGLGPALPKTRQLLFSAILLSLFTVGLSALFTCFPTSRWPTYPHSQPLLGPLLFCFVTNQSLRPPRLFRSLFSLFSLHAQLSWGTQLPLFSTTFLLFLPRTCFFVSSYFLSNNAQSFAYSSSLFISH